MKPHTMHCQDFMFIPLLLPILSGDGFSRWIALITQVNKDATIYLNIR